MRSMMAHYAILEDLAHFLENTRLFAKMYFGFFQQKKQTFINKNKLCNCFYAWIMPGVGKKFIEVTKHSFYGGRRADYKAMDFSKLYKKEQLVWYWNPKATNLLAVALLLRTNLQCSFLGIFWPEYGYQLFLW